MSFRGYPRNHPLLKIKVLRFLTFIRNNNLAYSMTACRSLFKPEDDIITSNSNLPIAFVTMPFGLCAIPPIGISTLKAVLNRAGLPSRIFNFNLEYLPWISRDLNVAWQLHDEIAYLWDFLPGEWLFSQQDGKDDKYLRDLAHESGVRSEVFRILVRLRSVSDKFVAYCGRRILDMCPQIVGFSTSFMQTQPSLAVARYVKAHKPETLVVFGGANAYGDMGPALLEEFPEIDFVALGEADMLIEPLIRAILADDQSAIDSLAGVAFRQDGKIVVRPDTNHPVSLDSLPEPDYDDYFETLKLMNTKGYTLPSLPLFLPIETSRGCWWGAKSHCVFCGLNGERIGFRAKSPQQASQEFFSLAQRYNMSRFFAVDNILPLSYFDSLMPTLSKHPRDFFIHYEIKANLCRSQIKAMTDAGIRKVQPGIESLSTPVLALMRKGVKALYNIQTLKWLTEFECQTSWFILFGIPGETAEHYRLTAKILPKIRHLHPPSDLAPVYIERFSPLQMRPSEFGIELLGPTRWYNYAFPKVSAERLERLSYRFDHVEPGRPAELDAAIEKLVRPLVESWKEHFDRHGCTLMIAVSDMETFLIVGPFSNPQKIIQLPLLHARLLRAADAIVNKNKLMVAAEQPVSVPEEIDLPASDLATYLSFWADRFVDHRKETAGNVEIAIGQLLQNGLLLEESSSVLTLPVAVTRSRLKVALNTEQGGKRHHV